MQSNSLALSPLDGRYAEKIAELKLIFSEFALMRYRLFIEVQWLKALNTDLSASLIIRLDAIYQNFDEAEMAQLKAIEQTTNHDVKAVEYYLREKLEQHPELISLSPWIHFACTSDDINNLAYGLMLFTYRQQILLPKLHEIIKILTLFAHDYADMPILSRTHGQAATPTTFGKEFANWVSRLKLQHQTLVSLKIYGKMNGAVGNFNAHKIAMPEKDWPLLAKEFVESLGLYYQSYTTQIEPHDYIAEFSHTLFRINTILIDVCRDIWGYISIDYLNQKAVASEIGSSTMPHKINPIDFENAEGNFYLANALLQCFAERLPISRWQRDLVDSTLMRNLGVTFGYIHVAHQSLLRGLQKVAVNHEKIQADLNQHWEILAEPIQMVMRVHGITDAYEELKHFTRGKKNLDAKTLHAFIDKLKLPEKVKKDLKQLTPTSYMGYAKKLAEVI